MEEKQLDFNAPLLSVRRFSSTTVSEGENSNKIENSVGNRPYLPRYKSELKSGPMRNPGAVPFLWEQIPGRRKDGEGSQDRPIEQPPIAPKLPPGRTSEVKQHLSDKEFKQTTISRPQFDNFSTSRQKVLPIDGNATKLESSKESITQIRDSDSEDGDDTYADALDTLSRTESLFFNCSVSGISGLDGPNVKSTGTFTTDPQTRDFMMGRFLPAAKAMASDTHQHASWRQPVTREQPTLVKKVSSGDRRPPLYQYRPNIIPQYVEETVEEESEDDDYGNTGDSSAKACGLFPRFCLKNSFCILNPVPGLKVRSRAPAPLPSVRKFGTHVKTAYPGSLTGIDNENNWDAVYKHKLMSGLQQLEDESKLTSESNQLTYWSDSQTPDESSAHMHLGGGGISPYRSEGLQSPFQEGTGFLGIPIQVKNFKPNSSIPFKGGKWGSGSLSPMVEKTLYVDSVHVMETSNSILNSSDTSRMIGCTEKDSKILAESQGIEDTPVAVSPPGGMNELDISLERGNLKPKISEVVGADLLSPSNRSNRGGNLGSMEGFRKDGDLDQESGSLVCSKVTTSGNLEFNKPESLKQDDHKDSFGFSLHGPLPPPLPKSPSESWLWRTLPSVSSRNGASFHPRKQSSKTSHIDPKWETIVKTSKVHHSHLRFSEEMTTPLP